MQIILQIQYLTLKSLIEEIDDNCASPIVVNLITLKINITDYKML